MTLNHKAIRSTINSVVIVAFVISIGFKLKQILINGGTAGSKLPDTEGRDKHNENYVDHEEPELEPELEPVCEKTESSN